MINVMLRCAIAASLVSFAFTSANANETVFHFTSEPEDYIGQGQTLTLTPADADFNVNRNFAGGVSVSINNFSFPNPPQFIFWSADFGAPSGVELTPGAYEGATRFPFNDPSEPGLSVSGDGRGCNTLTGRFDVLEAVYDPSTGDVLSFAADFEQHCEGAPPALFGSVRINSDVPLPVLLPPRISIVSVLNQDGCVEAAGPSGALAEFSASAPIPGTLEFAWSTSTGESAIGPDFSFLLGVDANATVFLTATDQITNEQATSMVQVCVSDTTPPQITILDPVEGQVLSGSNPRLTLSIDDAVDQEIDTVRVFVGHVADIPVSSKRDVVRTRIPPARSGPDGTMTQITVEATDEFGNTGSSTVNVLFEQNARRRNNDK